MASGRRAQKSYGSKPRTLDEGMAEFKQFLLMARDDKVLAITMPVVLQRYRVKPREAEYALLIAQQKIRERQNG